MERPILWHESDRTISIIAYIKNVFHLYPHIFNEINGIAKSIKQGIEKVNFFIQQSTSAVCPACTNRCCLNKHGYYDNLDILYITALGSEQPSYKQGLSDDEPCQFLSELGCVKERYIRPFRCNWYFCEPLLRHMEQGPARPYREFIRVFNEIIDLRAKLIQIFEQIDEHSDELHGISR